MIISVSHSVFLIVFLYVLAIFCLLLLSMYSFLKKKSVVLNQDSLYAQLIGCLVGILVS